MKYAITLLTTLLATLLATVLATLLTFGLAGVGGALAAPGAITYIPSDDTVVEVNGDKIHGFTITHYDGTVDTPPPADEAHDACRDHDTEVERVRCRTQVRVWYRGTMTLKRALNYAQSQS